MSEHRGAITQEGERYPSPRRTLDFLEGDPPESGHARQIGERLARQFEQRGRKPVGWMDVPHAQVAQVRPSDEPLAPPPPPSTPQDDDERFIVGLVLSYYRRHPQRARTRLLDLLGEVLTPATAPAGAAPVLAAVATAASGPAPAADEASELLRRSLQGVAPLKRRR